MYRHNSNFLSKPKHLVFKEIFLKFYRIMCKNRTVYYHMHRGRLNERPVQGGGMQFECSPAALLYRTNPSQLKKNHTIFKEYKFLKTRVYIIICIMFMRMRKYEYNLIRICADALQ